MNLAYSLSGAQPGPVGRIADSLSADMERKFSLVYERGHEMMQALASGDAESAPGRDQVRAFRQEVRDYLEWMSHNAYVPLQRSTPKAAWGDLKKMRSFAMKNYRMIWRLFQDMEDGPPSLSADDGHNLSEINRRLFGLRLVEKRFFTA